MKRIEAMAAPNALRSGLLGSFNQFQWMPWDEILSNNFEIIGAMAEAESISHIEVLNCILLLNPTRWKEFFWQLQYEKMFAETMQLKFQNIPLVQGTLEIAAAKKKADSEIMQNYIKEAERVKCSNGGKQKATNDRDGKQYAKRIIKTCWEAWQRNPTDYSSKADFARDMLEQFKDLKSQKNVEDWCRKWEKESEN